MSFLSQISNPLAKITYIENGLLFPESMDYLLKKYEKDIILFQELIKQSTSSAELLEKIRNPKIDSKVRMSLLKLFRRCVCSVCDTERTKKIKAVPTSKLVEHFGDAFKPIENLKSDFSNLSRDKIGALSMLIGEYDTRGQLGYMLTDLFFDWFESNLSNFKISGPRGAGSDIELSSLFSDYKGSYPCDFAIKDQKNNVLAN